MNGYNDDLNGLEVQPGDEMRAEQQNGVVRAIRRRKIRGGRGVLVRQYNDHVQVTYRAPSAPLVNHAWKPSWELSAVTPSLRFNRGLVNGIEPEINKGKISDPFSDPLPIPGYDQDLGDCLIYLELLLDPSSWAIAKATMIASTTKPEFTPFTARKLIAIVNQDGSIEPRVFFDLGFAASNRKSTGVFRPWWFMAGGTAL